MRFSEKLAFSRKLMVAGTAGEFTCPNIMVNGKISTRSSCRSVPNLKMLHLRVFLMAMRPGRLHRACAGKPRSSASPRAGGEI